MKGGQSFKIKIRRTLLHTGLGCYLLRVNWIEFQLILFLIFMFPLFISGTAIIFGFRIYNYQAIKEALIKAIAWALISLSIFALSASLLWPIFLGDLIEKIRSCPSFYFGDLKPCPADVKDIDDVDFYY